MDIAVIGAGPIGLYISSQLAQNGFDVHIFEEHSDIGNPQHCSGLFSEHIFSIVGSINHRGILHASSKARIVAPSGEALNIGTNVNRAYVVDRVEFDRSLARDAVRAGATIHLKERIKKIENLKITSTRREYRPRIVIGADGINSITRRVMGVSAPKLIGAAQVIAQYDYNSLDTVEIFVGNDVAPGFFAWAIPLGNELAKIGLGAYGNAWNYLKKLLKNVHAKPLSVGGGGIPIGTVKKTYASGMIIVGDAAGQVKATSGGGVYPGLRAAECAVPVVIQALESGNYEEKVLKNYEDCWKRSIGKELSKALYIHNFYRKIRDEDFNNIVNTLNRPDMIELINKYGDIDYPSKVIWQLFKKNPKLLKYMGIVTRR